MSSQSSSSTLNSGMGDTGTTDGQPDKQMLRAISDSAYETAMARLRAAAATEHGPVIDTLDLLVLRSASETGER